MKKSFVKPFYEVVHFTGQVIATSGCGCWDGLTDWGAGQNCKGDNPACECPRENYNPAVGNCITP